MKIGIGKGDVTAYYDRSGMLGYAMFFHIMKDIESPLYARAFVFENGDTKLCMVNCELCFITPSLRDGVLQLLKQKTLGYTEENLMINAQHTHCAPAGYSFHSLYNTSTPGLIMEVYQKIVQGIVEAIEDAEKNKVEAKIQIGKGKFEPELPVSFNRSIRAYNQNPEIDKTSYENRHLATDREMTMLKFVDHAGKALGSINWFAVHTTNLPNNFLRLSSDNKGFAAKYLEEEYQSSNKHYKAAFAQGACGDVSARYIFNPKLPFQRGKYEGKYPDDLKSARYNGHLQFGKAKEIHDNINQNTDCGDELNAIHLNVNMNQINIDPKFTDGIQDAVTSNACMGVSFLEGSKYDGPGMHPIVGFFAKGLSKLYKQQQKIRYKFSKNEQWKADLDRKHNAQGVKNIALEAVTHQVFGALHARKFIVPGFVDETIHNLKKFDQLGAYDNHPWTPQNLPLQIFRLGTIAICALPFEITTVASWRLKKTIAENLAGQGIEHVILAPYSNAYSGYITTYEEYQVQDYEGGHNVFGQFSLNALQQKFAELSQQLSLNKNDRTISDDARPAPFTKKELNRRQYFMGIYAKRDKKKAEKMIARRAKRAQRINQRVLK